MTMPDERFRAIRWGGELLQQMQDDRFVPARMRDRAKAIAQHYPSDAALRGALERVPTVMPENWLNAIENARALFDDLAASLVGGAETKRKLLYTMRHYPLRGETGQWSWQESWPWLQPD